MTSTTQRELLTTPPPANLQLVNWPLRDDGVAGWGFVVFVMGVAVVVGLLAQNAGLTLLSFAAMSLTMWRMWIPVTFELGPKGILQTVWRRKRRIVWSAVRRCRVQRRGVLLLFHDDPSRLSNVLGLYVRWGERRDELLAILRYYIASRLAEDEETT